MSKIFNFTNDGIYILSEYFENNKLDNINKKLYDFLLIKNQTYNRTDNCLHHILIYDKFLFIEILEKILDIELINNFLGKYILHSFGAVINKQNSNGYTHNFHIDSYEPNTSLMLNILIPLTDFTIENGCIKIYAKNSNIAYDIELKKGDLLIFDSSLLHATGNNQTEFDRNCLTITLTKIYCKPQFNYIKLFNDSEIEKLSNPIKNLLNFNSQIFENLEDFYEKKYIYK